MLITAANGKQSVDAVTVTIGGKTPTVLAAGQTIQNAIDTAKPGDMIIVPAGKYNEMLLMWKPVRLQGVGAASSIINANTQPAGKLDPWRKHVVCLFGLTPDGRPNPGDNQAADRLDCASGGPEFPGMIVDRVPMEGILGWDTSVNGNLAEQLQEPSLMGAYEGAAITVLGKGVDSRRFRGSVRQWQPTESAFSRHKHHASFGRQRHRNRIRIPTNFYCNPSSIDGLSITEQLPGRWRHLRPCLGTSDPDCQQPDSQQYRNAVGWHHRRPRRTSLTYRSRGMPTPFLQARARPATSRTSPCRTATTTNVNVHNNDITLNSSTGDELFSSTPAGAGGVSLCNGADYYNFNYNWVCGNLSTGDGGGVAHIGFSKNGNIPHNTILFNQSTNPTIPTNGGGLLIMGAPDPDPTCGATTRPRLRR